MNLVPCKRGLSVSFKSRPTNELIRQKLQEQVSATIIGEQKALYTLSKIPLY